MITLTHACHRAVLKVYDTKIKSQSIKLTHKMESDITRYLSDYNMNFDDLVLSDGTKEDKKFIINRLSKYDFVENSKSTPWRYQPNVLNLRKYIQLCYIYSTDNYNLCKLDKVLVNNIHEWYSDEYVYKINHRYLTLILGNTKTINHDVIYRLAMNNVRFMEKTIGGANDIVRKTHYSNTLCYILQFCINYGIIIVTFQENNKKYIELKIKMLFDAIIETNKVPKLSIYVSYLIKTDHECNIITTLANKYPSIIINDTF